MKTVFFAVMTVNGKIAHASNEPVDWNSPEDKAFFRRERERYGAVVMGNNTYKTRGRPRPVALFQSFI